MSFSLISVGNGACSSLIFFSGEENAAQKGREILYALDSSKPSICGWFRGRVSHFGVGQRDRAKTPTANFVVTYNQKITKNKDLVGRVACELSAQKYGPKEWWVLLDPATS